MELLAPAVREDNLPDLELIDLSVEHRLLRLGVSALFLQLCLETADAEGERVVHPPKLCSDLRPARWNGKGIRQLRAAALLSVRASWLMSVGFSCTDEGLMSTIR